MPDKQVKMYAKLTKEIDTTLDNKRISYAQFSNELNIPAIAFYNKYKAQSFPIEDMMRFLALAKSMSPKMINCIKCGSEFMPKTKSVKRAFCEACKNEMRKKVENSDAIKFKYPAWVTGMTDWAIRNLVEQEYHIDEETAQAMSVATTVEEAKAIRANRWKCSTMATSSVVYDTMNYIKFG